MFVSIFDSVVAFVFIAIFVCVAVSVEVSLFVSATRQMQELCRTAMVGSCC